MKKIKILLLVFIIVFIGVAGVFGYNYYTKQKEEKLALEQKEKEKKLLKQIENNYGEFVKTNKDAKIYVLDKEYKESGVISKDAILSLDKQELTFETKYFKIINLDREYYISYEDVSKAESISKNNRYLNYIPFNKNVITNETTNFYLNDAKVYTINKSFNLPIYIMDGDKYFIEYDNQLMYILKEDVKEIIDNNNSNKEKANQIATILYHFIYNPDGEETCYESICHTMSQVQTHIDYLKQNSYFTPTLKEFEMWIDGKLNLPKKSLVITLDDGGYGHNAKEIFDRNKINAALFMVGAWFDPGQYESEYLEVHSHGYDLHNANVCPGQGNFGGGIMCLPRETLLADLKKSREETHMTTYFAYPFYDFNNYSISILKEAGFTMGFGGYYQNGRHNMVIGGDKFRIPRVTFDSTTNNNDLHMVLSTYNY